MSFEAVHIKWLEKHLKERKGEKKRRLEQGHGHGEVLFLEKVWYPAFKQLEHLHPEYVVADFRDGTRFLDFAFIRYPLRLAIEIDGYRSHSSEITRWQFSDSLMRQNHLILDGWRILRFSYDDINDKPRMCQQMIQQFMGTWLLDASVQTSEKNILEVEVLRLGIRLNRPLRPIDVCDFLKISKRRARSILQEMNNKQMILIAGKGSARICSYKINVDRLNENEHLLF